MHCQEGARGSTQCTATGQGHLESRAGEAPWGPTQCTAREALGTRRNALPEKHQGPTQCTVREAQGVPRNALPHGSGTWRAVQGRHPGPDAVHC
ncbi:hypothetical protein NDU88_008702 [Pleurodeles waltl]|uniref:Uncharacterized protein n=1 Tax=Pleurodeles waltl TaxID=8319 RepID=A0AAV7N5P5_PLEWA|nr:hypothetical protein NDU88_008702 [Pleurodeles waltl]